MIGNIIQTVGNIIEKVVPDTNARNLAKSKLIELEQSGELQRDLAQIELNKLEAQGAWYQRAWRPLVGWTCALALFSNYIVAPYVSIWHPVPVLDAGTLTPILLGLLGLGGYRTFEKYTGKS